MIKFASSFLSLSKLLSSDRIRLELVREVIDLLTPRLKGFNIVWNPKVFREALLGGGVPRPLLEKLEVLLKTVIRQNGKVSPAIVLKLDSVVEDIESFNPSFRKSLASRANGKTAKRPLIKSPSRRK